MKLVGTGTCTALTTLDKGLGDTAVACRRKYWERVGEFLDKDYIRIPGRKGLSKYKAEGKGFFDLVQSQRNYYHENINSENCSYTLKLRNSGRDAM